MRGGGIGIFAVCSLSYLLGFLDLLVFDLLVLSVVVGGGVCGEGGPAVGWRSRVHGRGQQRVVFFLLPPFHTTNGFVLSVGGFNHEGDG